MPLVYDELRKLAAAKLAHEKPGQTLEATALVHEAFLRLVANGDASAPESSISTIAATSSRPRPKRCGGFWSRMPAARRPRNTAAGCSATTRPNCPSPPRTAEDLVALDEALNQLAALDSTKAELVKLRYFAGLTIEEAADVLGISPATAKRYWTYSRAWLFQAMSGVTGERSGVSGPSQ